MIRTDSRVQSAYLQDIRLPREAEVASWLTKSHCIQNKKEAFNNFQCGVCTVGFGISEQRDPELSGENKLEIRHLLAR